MLKSLEDATLDPLIREATVRLDTRNRTAPPVARGTDAPEGAIGEGIAVHAAGNVYTAEATVRGVTKYVKD